MVMSKFNWHYTIMVLLIFLQHQLVVSSAAINLSPATQKNALYQFKKSLAISTTAECSYYFPPFEYYIPSHPKTMNWSMSSDHCTWDGVTCEQKTGNVIGLDLSCSHLVGAILPNSTLFQLSHLEFLNLSQNYFSNQFHQEFGFFATGLTHLNLSSSGFSGRVPSGISHLYKLVSLDLSELSISAKLEDEVFKSLLQNLTQLRVLNLPQVDIYSVLPMNLSTSLRVLNLRSTGLYGVSPQEIFHLPNLEILELSFNENLIVTLPKVKWGSRNSLEHLYLGSINLDGGIPNSVVFLESLSSLFLQNCNLSGSIPKFIGNLTRLTYLDLSRNHLNGQIPLVLANLTNLRILELSSSNLSGPFPSWVVHLRELNFLNLRNNLLYGPITQSFSIAKNLIELDISSNNFSGVLDIKMFSGLKYLYHLDLSHNNLLVRSTGMSTLPSNLNFLGLSSCKMKTFPHFSGDPQFIVHVDLSSNQIDEELSSWIGSVGRNSLTYLNLSHNSLKGGLDKLPWNYIELLDLRYNLLNGSLPTTICNSSSIQILNLSHNNFSGELPICPTNLSPLSVFDLRMNNIHGNLPSTLSNFRYLKSINLNGNKIEGRIPSSFAEFNQLEILDLGSNQISDTFPLCLEALPNLQVLILKSNIFHGHINKSSKIEHPFSSLRIIDLSYNEFSGPLPAIYFKNFKSMMNANVNKIEPSYMEYGSYYSYSTDLVIKGVETVLERILTVFTTIDVSRNNQIS